MAIGVTGFDDPENEAPWAMQLAFVVEKSAPPSVTAVCEAAATSVVRLLADPRSSGEWAPEMSRWLSGRIRKVVRRASPAHFARAEHLPGVTCEHRGATVRAFVPGPTNQLPADLRRLQVSGSPLAELGTPSVASVRLLVNPSLEMTVGKTAAQVSHAAQLLWLRSSAPERTAWEQSGFALAVEHPSREVWQESLPLARERVVDAGFTEIPAGSNTVVALS